MKYTAILFLLMLPALLLKSQQKDYPVDKIRKQVQLVNAARGLTVKVLKSEEFLDQTPDGGGELKGYYQAGKLLKIVEWLGLSNCTQTTEYYLHEGKLIFVYCSGKDFSYLKAGGTTTPKLVMECRFYYQNGQLLKSLIKGKTKCSGSPNEDWAKQFNNSFVKYKELLKD